MFYGIRSMRQTIKILGVNTAYRWFLGLSLDDRYHILTYGGTIADALKTRKC